MAKNGCSEFFLTIFPKKTGINLEWPKMAIPNFLQQFFPKRLVKIQNGQRLQFIETFLVQKRLEEIWNGQNWAFQIFSNL